MHSKNLAMSVASLALVIVICPAIAGDGKVVDKSPLDHATLYQDSISKEVPVRIRTFSTEDADLGTGAKKNKPKYQQIAAEMKANAPGLLLTSLTENLKEYGFTDVEPMNDKGPMLEECLVIEGEFTVLNPGSKSKRYMAGFGAGKSQVCAAGRVINAAGDLLLEFDHCRHEAMGLFGGQSEGQMTKDTEATGSHLAEFMAKWADGAYVN